jgi:ATP-dependent protease ClpP protease subunit
MEVMMKFYQEHTKYTAEEIELRIKTDWYVRLPEASTRGMVDEVITDIDVFC